MNKSIAALAIIGFVFLFVAVMYIGVNYESAKTVQGIAVLQCDQRGDVLAGPSGLVKLSPDACVQQLVQEIGT